MNEDDYREWRKHPITEAFFDFFSKELKGVEGDILTGGFLHKEGRIEDMYVLFGKKEILELILEIKEEHLNENEEEREVHG